MWALNLFYSRETLPLIPIQFLKMQTFVSFAYGSSFEDYHSEKHIIITTMMKQKQRAQWRSEARAQETTNRTTVGPTTDINSYCPFDISRKDVFCLAFCFKRRHFVLIDHILSETFTDSVFSSRIFTVKLDLRPKNGLTYANSIINWFFEIFVCGNTFYFSLLTLNYWCATTILWKFQKKINKRNLLKICLQVTYPTDFCIICIHFYYGEKVKIFDLLNTND